MKARKTRERKRNEKKKAAWKRKGVRRNPAETAKGEYRYTKEKKEVITSDDDKNKGSGK